MSKKKRARRDFINASIEIENEMRLMAEEASGFFEFSTSLEISKELSAIGVTTAHKRRDLQFA